MAVSLYLLALAIAYASLRVFDELVREWFKERVLHKKSQKG